MAAHEDYPITRLSPIDFPPLLREMDTPPTTLYIRGRMPDHARTMIAVVGSRRHTSYGKAVAESLILGLRGTPIVIVSGLAIGIDAIAHRAALEAGIPTVAVPGSGLDWNVMYPRQHQELAAEILKNGGALLSEYEPDFRATTWSFPKRNRIMAGLSKAVLLIEAHEKSGTLVTARLAMEENRDVLAVPGPITNEASRGTNRLIREGAIPITSSDDILEALGLPRKDEDGGAKPEMSDEEDSLWDILEEPLTRDAISEILDLSPETLNQKIMDMQLKGLLKETGGMITRA